MKSTNKIKKKRLSKYIFLQFGFVIVTLPFELL
jgi:hypothetical protein